MPLVRAFSAMKRAICLISASLSLRKPVQSTTTRLSSPSGRRKAVATTCWSACRPSPPRRIKTPPSSPSRLMRVPSGESSIRAVSSTPIAFTTLCTKSAICLVKVSFTLRPRRLSTLAFSGGRATGSCVLHAAFRGGTCSRHHWWPNHPVREVLLPDCPEVPDKPILHPVREALLPDWPERPDKPMQNEAAWNPQEHDAEHQRHHHHDFLLRRISR